MRRDGDRVVADEVWMRSSSIVGSLPKIASARPGRVGDPLADSLTLTTSPRLVPFTTTMSAAVAGAPPGGQVGATV